MKQHIIIFLLLFSYSFCKSQAKEKVIPYLLGIEAEKTIYDYIKNIKEKDSIAFYMESIPDEKYKIHFLAKVRENNHAVSNRMLFINDRFYPLILDSDYWFYVKMEKSFPIVRKFENEDEKESKYIKIPTIEERIKNRALIIKDGLYPIYELTVNWTVDRKGNFIT